MLETLRPLLEDPRVLKASPNAKQAMVALGRFGIDLRGVEFDSGSRPTSSRRRSATFTLQDLSWSRLNRELPSIKAVTGEGRSALALDAVPIGKMAEHMWPGSGGAHRGPPDSGAASWWRGAWTSCTATSSCRW